MSNTLIAERQGQRLKAEFFETDGGSGCRFFINEQLVKEENYTGHNISWAQDAAENWLDGIKVLKG